MFTAMIIDDENTVRAGYQSLYLEPHTNLETAIRLYEKNGFRRMEKPESVCHSTMNRFYWKEL